MNGPHRGLEVTTSEVIGSEAEHSRSPQAAKLDFFAAHATTKRQDLRLCAEKLHRVQ